MAITALSGTGSEWYEPEREKTDNDGNVSEVVFEEGAILTGFKIRPLSGAEYLDVISDPGMGGVKKAFRFCLEGWRNFTDESGKEVDFSKAEAAKLIPAKYMLSIGSRAIKISTFDGEKAKN